MKRPVLDFIQILEVMRCTQEIGFDLESGFCEPSQAVVLCSAISRG